MPIDAAKAVAAEPRSAEIRWDRKDVLLYHLGLGAGVPATDPDELRYTLESRLHVLPSFATVAGAGAWRRRRTRQARARHRPRHPYCTADRRVELHRPIPVEGTAVSTSRVAAVYDKGKAAVLVLRTEAADGDGPAVDERRPDLRTRRGRLRRRARALRAPRTPRPRARQDRRADIREDQALLYRLSGDFNPLHADPEFAELAGFDRPILHGLCTYGMTLKAVVDTVLGGDVGRVRSYTTRFAGVVFPGETLRIRMWASETGRVQVAVTAVERDDAPVLADTLVEHS